MKPMMSTTHNLYRVHTIYIHTDKVLFSIEGFIRLFLLVDVVVRCLRLNLELAVFTRVTGWIGHVYHQS